MPTERGHFSPRCHLAQSYMCYHVRYYYFHLICNVSFIWRFELKRLTFWKSPSCRWQGWCSAYGLPRNRRETGANSRFVGSGWRKTAKCTSWCFTVTITLKVIATTWFRISMIGVYMWSVCQLSEGNGHWGVCGFIHGWAHRCYGEEKLVSENVNFQVMPKRL